MVKSFLGFFGRALVGGIFVFSSMHVILNWQSSERRLHEALMTWQPAIPQISITHKETTHLDIPSIEQSQPLTKDSETVQRQSTTEMMNWCVAHTSLLMLLAVAVSFVGGALVFLGLAVRFGAFLLLCFVVPATFLFHSFWSMQDPQRQIEQMNFIKNLGIIGGLLFILARGKHDSLSGEDPQINPSNTTKL